MPDEPTVAIYRSGALSLNREAFQLFGSPAAVELLFDRTSQCIGLRGVDGRVRHSYPVRATAASRFVVSARAFLHFYDLLGDESLRWSAGLHDGVLSIDLSEPGLPVRQVSMS